MAAQHSAGDTATMCRAMAHDCVCYHLRRAARAVTKRYDERLAAVGLRATQLTLLSAVNLRGRELNVSELAEVLAIEQSALSRNLALLRRRRLVRSIAGPDRRQARLVLTAAGERALARAFPIWAALQLELEEATATGAVRAAVRTARLVGGSPPRRRTPARAAR